MQLPFTQAEFLQVFVTYNFAIWPIQVFTTLLGLAAVVLLLKRPSWALPVIAAMLSFCWMLIGVLYHPVFFAAVNPAAYGFGVLFALAGLAFLIEGTFRKRGRLEPLTGPRGMAAVILIVYAIGVYPAIGLLETHPYPQTPLFGVAPCPTVIFTLAILLLWRHPRPWVLASIPLLWSLVGGSAAWLLSVPADLGLFAAALVWVGFRMRRLRDPA